MKVRFYSSLSPAGPLRSVAARRLERYIDGSFLFTFTCLDVVVCYLAARFAPVKMGRAVSLNQHCHRKFLRPLQPLPGVWSDSDLRGAELVFGRVWGKNGPSFRFPTLEQTNKQGWIIRGRYQGNFDKLSGICRLWKGRRLEKTSCLTFKA